MSSTPQRLASKHARRVAAQPRGHGSRRLSAARRAGTRRERRAGRECGAHEHAHALLCREARLHVRNTTHKAQRPRLRLPPRPSCVTGVGQPAEHPSVLYAAVGGSAPCLWRFPWRAATCTSTTRTGAPARPGPAQLKTSCLSQASKTSCLKTSCPGPARPSPAECRAKRGHRPWHAAVLRCYPAVGGPSRVLVPRFMLALALLIVPL